MHETMVTKALDIGIVMSEREHIYKVIHIIAFFILGCWECIQVAV